MAGRIISNLQSTPAAKCLKVLLTVFNFIFWVSGIAILALGIWMKVELYAYARLTSLYYSEAPYILMGVGAAIVVVGSFGCCCTIKGKSFFLYLYAFFLFLVFITEIALAISLLVYKSKVTAGFETGLQKAIDNYTVEKNKDAIDGLQKRLSCCGKHSYTDWFETEWDGAKTKHNSVPPSCCKKKGCKNTGLHKTADKETMDAIYTEGCYKKVTKFMKAKFVIIAGVAFGFGFLQLFGCLLAGCLAMVINRSKYEQVA